MTKIVLDIGGTNIKSAYVEEGIIENMIEVPAGKTKEEFLKNLNASIKSHKKKVTSISLGMPGPLNNGVTGKLNNLPLSHFPIHEYLTKRYKCTVKVENDANCFVLGEHLKGQAQGYDNVLGITLGTGFGVGIIINGRLYKGRGNSGEIASAPYLDKTFEYYLGKKAIIRFAKEEGIRIKEPHRISHPKYKSIWKKYGFHLGEALSIMIRLLDPDVVVIGGKISRSHFLFGKEMERQIKKCIDNAPPIRVSNENPALYGASVL